MTTLDTQTLVAILGHDNVFNLQLSVDGAPVDATGKSATAKVSYTGAGTPLALAIASGLTWTAIAIGKIALALSTAQLAAMDVNQPVFIYFTVWNADNSIWGHGSFSLSLSLG